MSVSQHQSHKRDIYLALASLGLAALLFYGSMGLPPPRFEPMGSAALPRIMAGLIVLFSLILLFGAVRQSIGASASDLEISAPSGASGIARLRPLGVPACLIAYVGALDFLQAPFVPSTIILVVALGLLLSKPTIRTAVIFALFGIVISILINLVFTHFLYVDLG
jgi:putative tricarboxylic transport membrane protein